MLCPEWVTSLIAVRMDHLTLSLCICPPVEEAEDLGLTGLCGNWKRIKVTGNKKLKMTIADRA